MTNYSIQWLIRTHDFQIMGPISREKLIELYKNGSLHEKDEICPGNGHWFFINEKNYVDQYLLNENVMSFNPMGEAESVYQNEYQNQSQHQKGEVAEKLSSNTTANVTSHTHPSSKISSKGSGTNTDEETGSDQSSREVGEDLSHKKKNKLMWNWNDIKVNQLHFLIGLLFVLSIFLVLFFKKILKIL
jgi:hypothetical protein